MLQLRLEEVLGAIGSSRQIRQKSLHEAKQSAVRRVSWVSRWPSHVVGLECQELADSVEYMQVITRPAFMTEDDEYIK